MKGKKTAKKNNIRDEISKILDMPVDMIKNISRMTVIGNEKILIENHKGIMEYDENIIRFTNEVVVVGDNLKIEEITDDDVLITGKINNIEFDY